jgi:hypothetical protein
VTEAEHQQPQLPVIGLSPTPGGGWVPVPDPTERTTRELRRELATQREILEAQMQSFVEAMRARLDAMDVANELRLAEFRQIPESIREQVAHLRELTDERFASIALQFKERDERATQLAKSQADALEAALRAAKELNAAQGESNKEANAKTEVTFGQQIKAVEDKIEVINRRLDTGQGSAEGATAQRADTRLNMGAVVGWGLFLISVLSFVLLYSAKR